MCICRGECWERLGLQIILEMHQNVSLQSLKFTLQVWECHIDNAHIALLHKRAYDVCDWPVKCHMQYSATERNLKIESRVCFCEYRWTDIIKYFVNKILATCYKNTFNWISEVLHISILSVGLTFILSVNEIKHRS